MAKVDLTAEALLGVELEAPVAAAPVPLAAPETVPEARPEAEASVPEAEALAVPAITVVMPDTVLVTEAVGVEPEAEPEEDAPVAVAEAEPEPEALAEPEAVGEAVTLLSSESGSSSISRKVHSSWTIVQLVEHFLTYRQR